MERGHNRKDMTGKRIRTVVVTARADNIGKKCAWRVLCDCGFVYVAAGLSLRRGKIKTHRCTARICAVAGCTRFPSQAGMCAAHAMRVKRRGDALAHIPIRPPRNCPSKYKYKMHKGKHDLEHRVVMQIHLGRELLTHESVHHKNGDTRDNRLSNLELWSKGQPAGQRVEDKIAWAIELLSIYRPEALAKA